MKCKKCNWSWKIEKDDTNPYLCHKCGYDSLLNKYDMKSFNKWKSDNPTKLKHLKRFRN